MGWETRRGKRVYYRKVRGEDGRVHSVYCGSGERGEQAAREDALQRETPAAHSSEQPAESPAAPGAPAPAPSSPGLLIIPSRLSALAPAPAAPWLSYPAPHPPDTRRSHKGPCGLGRRLAENERLRRFGWGR